MEKLNMKLAKWRFPDSAINDMGDHLWVHWPFGREHWLASESIKPFTESLDACFKWLVPKFWVCSMTIEEGIFAVVKVGHPNMGSASQLEEIRDGNPLKAFALALCLAIEKLIDKEEPDEGNQNTNPTT